MSALKILYATAALAAGLSFAGTAFALNPQPEPPGMPALADGGRKPTKAKQIKLPPDPCKSARVCRY